MTLRDVIAAALETTSFPGPFPWLEGGAGKASPSSQGKGPGNEVALGKVHLIGKGGGGMKILKREA